MSSMRSLAARPRRQRIARASVAGFALRQRPARPAPSNSNVSSRSLLRRRRPAPVPGTDAPSPRCISAHGSSRKQVELVEAKRERSEGEGPRERKRRDVVMVGGRIRHVLADADVPASLQPDDGRAAREPGRPRPAERLEAVGLDDEGEIGEPTVRAGGGLGKGGHTPQDALTTRWTQAPHVRRGRRGIRR
jgi:hypothetical protein